MSPTALEEMVKTVRQRIEQHIEEYLQVKDLLHDLTISAGTLNKAFETTYQVSVYSYHKQCKMEYGKSLLVKGIQVKAVAIILGYSTTGSFSRAFKAVFHYPPQFYKLQ